MAIWPFTARVCQPTLSMTGIQQHVLYQRKEGEENYETVPWEQLETLSLSPLLSLYKYLHLMQRHPFNLSISWATRLSPFGPREKKQQKSEQLTHSSIFFFFLIRKHKLVCSSLLTSLFLQPGHYFKLEHVLVKTLWFKVVPAIIPLVWGCWGLSFKIGYE